MRRDSYIWDVTQDVIYSKEPLRIILRNNRVLLFVYTLIICIQAPFWAHRTSRPLWAMPDYEPCRIQSRHMWMSHVTLSHVTYAWVTSQWVTSLVKEWCHTCEWVTSLVYESFLLWTSHVSLFVNAGTVFGQHAATHCDTLRHTATYCNALKHTSTHCHTLQHTVTHCNTLILCMQAPF